MHVRYSNPGVNLLWDDTWTFGAWLEIERTTLRAQLEQGILTDPDAADLLTWLRECHINDTAAGEIRVIERTTKHDVAAFLGWLRGEADTELGNASRYLHFGLTSSDVVDTAQGMRFKIMQMNALSPLGNLLSELNRWSLDDTTLVGRTHGQVAELITMRARAGGWLGLLAPGIAELSRRTSHMASCKLSGTVGTFAHNPPGIEAEVAKRLGLRPVGAGATQIVPRSVLAAWANAANMVVQSCAKIAHDIRLMNLLGEVRIEQTPGQVGSSAMAHKTNPIGAEQIGGMARLAQGYALMLQDQVVWLERDMSHSSVERVAVPDLWHVVLHTIDQTVTLLRDLDLDLWNIDSMVRSSDGVLVHGRTLEAIAQGHPVEEARRRAMSGLAGVHAQPEDGKRAMQNYPAR